MIASQFRRMSIQLTIYVAIFVMMTSSATAFQKIRYQQMSSRASSRTPIRGNFQNDLFFKKCTDDSRSTRSDTRLFSSSIVETSLDDSSGNSTTIIAAPATTSIFSKLKNLLQGKGFSGASLNKAGLSKLGLNCLLAYGFVSNVSYITCLILAWITHGKSTGLSPLAQGQWKKYLLVYATFFAANNLLRPLRFSLSLAITPAFDKFIDLIQQRTGWTRRNSTAITVFLVNICGTFTYLFGGLFLATTIAKVPLLP
jgi:hypothetical protein